jgi:DeoR/GlpR family transcriptional regulator of sugar metabolism
VTVLADHTKLGTVGMTTMAGLRDVDVVITDAGMPEPDRQDLGEHVRELRVAPVA